MKKILLGHRQSGATISRSFSYLIMDLSLHRRDRQAYKAEKIPKLIKLSSRPQRYSKNETFPHFNIYNIRYRFDSTDVDDGSKLGYESESGKSNEYDAPASFTE